jgi:hypothetical protein
MNPTDEGEDDHVKSEAGETLRKIRSMLPRRGPEKKIAGQTLGNGTAVHQPLEAVPRIRLATCGTARGSPMLPSHRGHHTTSGRSRSCWGTAT